MPTTGSPPGPCLLCGGAESSRGRDGWVCTRCEWPAGAVPDPDLAPPRIEVVYYLRSADRVKIGTSGNPRQRLAALGQGELLALERGGHGLEQQRHREFAAQRIGGEWFAATAPLTDHIAAIAAASAPWDAYARWMSAALRAR